MNKPFANTNTNTNERTNRFVLDVASCIPFDVLARDASDSTAMTKAAKVFKLLRFMRMGKLVKNLDAMAKSSIKVTQMLGVAVLLFHWVACGWQVRTVLSH